MNYAIVLRKEAQVDLDEIFIWYEGQLNGLGFRFLSELEKALDKIVRNPFHASIIEGEARSVTLHNFPYEVIYNVDNASITVRIIAIIHQHRDPSWFKKRIEG